MVAVEGLLAEGGSRCKALLLCGSFQDLGSPARAIGYSLNSLKGVIWGLYRGVL